MYSIFNFINTKEKFAVAKPNEESACDYLFKCYGYDDLDVRYIGLMSEEQVFYSNMDVY